MAQVELPADYYLTNFRALVDFVMEHYQPLLSARERHFYSVFTAQDINSQRLYVRLLSRKGVLSSAGPLFRLSKLNYPEIQNLTAAANTLVDVGLLQHNPELPLAELLPLFTKTELLQQAPQSLPKTLKRPLLEQVLLQLNADNLQHSLAEKLRESDTVLAVNDANHFDTFKLCFFGNLRQDLTEYVLRDLGLYRFENYPLDRQNLPFQTRAQLEQHLSYYQCLEQLENALAGGEQEILALARQLPPGWQGDAALQRRLERVRLTLARQLERLEALESADLLYRQCTQPPARERRARIAIRRGNIDAGLDLCREILQAPRTEAETVFAEGFGYRTAKKAKRLQDWKPPLKYVSPTETVILPYTANRVELLAAAHLEQDPAGGQCFYVENTLLNGTLGLYIWDILFAPLAGAFFNPFQSAPSDFRSADFYRLRRTAFEQRLAELDSDRLRQRVLHHYRLKQGIANPLVAWPALPEPLLELALERIPAAHWRAMFQRLLEDIQHHRNGLPDLIWFPAAGGYELVEVKGPGDRLQENQQRWLAFFARHQIPHRVLHIEWEQP